ncbi:hypothetical protein ACJJTC_017896 [Scirpophaga incertulas]
MRTNNEFAHQLIVTIKHFVSVQETRIKPASTHAPRRGGLPDAASCPENHPAISWLPPQQLLRNPNIPRLTPLFSGKLDSVINLFKAPNVYFVTDNPTRTPSFHRDSTACWFLLERLHLPGDQLMMVNLSKIPTLFG